MKTRSPSWHWPDRRHLGRFVLRFAAVSAWFALLYGAADYITQQRACRVRVHLDLDLCVPFVPAAVLGYLSIYPLFALAPFVLTTRRQLDALALTLAAVTLCGFVCFLLVPAATAFPPDEAPGPWAGLVGFARQVALRHNWLPSLHVALSVACVGAYARSARRPAKAALWLWAMAIAASTMLLHQHYLLDVVTGFALGLAGTCWVYDRWLRNAPGAAVEIPPANRERYQVPQV